MRTPSPAKSKTVTPRLAEEPCSPLSVATKGNLSARESTSTRQAEDEQPELNWQSVIQGKIKFSSLIEQTNHVPSGGENYLMTE